MSMTSHMSTMSGSVLETLYLVRDGAPACGVLIDRAASEGERRAADELIACVQQMTGARLPIHTELATPRSPRLVVGSSCFALSDAMRAWRDEIDARPRHFRRDAIRLLRAGLDVFLCGSNDDSHFFAVVELLEMFGCRWVMPGPIGECIPRHKHLRIDRLDLSYVPPFELREYWISWEGSLRGQAEFRRRNRYHEPIQKKSLMEKATQGLCDPREPHKVALRRLDLESPAVIEHAAEVIEEFYVTRDRISLHSGEIAESAAEYRNIPSRTGLWNKYTGLPSRTDEFFHFYNEVARTLERRHPGLNTKVLTWAYSDLLLPPQRTIDLGKNLYVYFIPIQQPQYIPHDRPGDVTKQEMAAMLTRWATLAPGRVIAYRHDQSQMVWRYLPNVTSDAVASDVKLYRRLNLLGVTVESRGLSAITVFNHYVNGRLYWNPDAPLEEILGDLYERFFECLSVPLGRYWEEIRRAWARTGAHGTEYFMAPLVFTDPLLRRLAADLREAKALARRLGTDGVPERVRRRLEFTELSHAITAAQMAGWNAAARDADYAEAIRHLESVDAPVARLAELDPTMVAPPESRSATHPAAHTARGELEQFRGVHARLAGPRGRLVLRTDRRWWFCPDPKGSGLPLGWGRRFPEDASRRRVDTAIHLQGQPGLHRFRGLGWYMTEIRLEAPSSRLHLLFPALFNPAWLYVNGLLVAHREFSPIWWYEPDAGRLEWDVPLPSLRSGVSTLTLRIDNTHEYGGILRRPVIYEATDEH